MSNYWQVWVCGSRWKKKGSAYVGVCACARTCSQTGSRAKLKRAALSIPKAASCQTRVISPRSTTEREMTTQTTGRDRNDTRRRQNGRMWRKVRWYISSQVKFCQRRLTCTSDGRLMGQYIKGYTHTDGCWLDWSSELDKIIIIIIIIISFIYIAPFIHRIQLKVLHLTQ